MGGGLEFYDVNDMTMMASMEHFMATDVEWDPTGRYVVSAVSYWTHKVDNSYWIWTFQGKLLHRQNVHQFCQLTWRPRPASLLTEDHIRELRKKMKQYSTMFERQDRLKASKASKAIIEERQRKMREYTKWKDQATKALEEKPPDEAGDEGEEGERGQGAAVQKNTQEYTEEVIEFLVNIVETDAE